MDVSKNNGTPKSSILIGFSIINHPFWDTVPLFLETPISPSPNFAVTLGKIFPPYQPLPSFRLAENRKATKGYPLRLRIFFHTFSSGL